MDPEKCKNLKEAKLKLAQKSHEKMKKLASCRKFIKSRKPKATENDFLNSENYKTISAASDVEISMWQKRIQEIEDESTRKRKLPPAKHENILGMSDPPENRKKKATVESFVDIYESNDDDEDVGEDDEEEEAAEREFIMSYLKKEKPTDLDLVLQSLNNGTALSNPDSSQEDAFGTKQGVEVIHFNGRSFHQNKCYYYEHDDKALILGIVGFYSKTEAKCVLVRPFSDTILGTTEEGVDFEPTWTPTPYVQIEFSLDPIPLLTLGDACPDVPTIPDLCYKVSVPGEWLHFAYYYNHKRRLSGKRNCDIRVVDMFAGAGIMSQGLHCNHGVKTICAVELNKKAADTFKQNHPETKVENMDVKIWNDQCKERQEYRADLGRVDWLHASSPCQGFSKANRNGGINDKQNNDLSLEWPKAVSIHRPVVATFENVPGMWDTKNRHYLLNIICSLMKMDYQVRCCWLNASHYGDAQARPRLFIFAARKFAYLPAFPPKTHGKGASMHVVTVDDALKGFPKKEQPMSDSVYPDDWLRLDPDAPASTIRASAQPPLYKNHPITIDEMKALFSLPPDYQLVGSEKDQRRQLGNSVPVGLAAAVGRSVAAVLQYRYCEEEEDNKDESP